jgi:hypothetical protein
MDAGPFVFPKTGNKIVQDAQTVAPHLNGMCDFN